MFSSWSAIVLEMSTHHGLADLLFGRTRGAIILALPYGHPVQSFYRRQIAPKHILERWERLG